MIRKRREDHEDRPVDGLLQFGFTKRWLAKLAQAEREGGWWFLDAESQNGKSTANNYYRNRQRIEKQASGTTIVPVAVSCAAEGERMLLAALADSLGGARLVRQPQRGLAIARAMVRVGTRLVIVNNGHAMDWRQWQAILTLEELYKANGIDPAIVFSSVNRNVGLASVRTHDGTSDQLRRRLRFEHVEGNSKADVRAALELLVARDGPDAFGEAFVDQSDLVFELLTEGILASDERRVITRDLLDLFRRVVAVHRKLADASDEELIREAHQHLIESRTQGEGKNDHAEAA